MARTPVFVEAKDNAGNYVSGASVSVVDRHTGAAATLYNAESGGSTISNPQTTNAAGQVNCWADRGSYMAVVTGGGLNYSIPLDGSTAADGTGVSPWLPGGLIANTGFFGKTVTATSETTTATSYAVGNLTTPDRVQNVVVGSAGLIMVAYRALWAATAANGGFVSIFVGTDQVNAVLVSAAGVWNVATGPNVNDFEILSTHNGVMASSQVAGNAADVTTGQTWSAAATAVLGAAPIYIMAAAGTYDVSVQFRATAGNTVTVKNRQLYVWSAP